MSSRSPIVSGLVAVLASCAGARPHEATTAEPAPTELAPTGKGELGLSLRVSDLDPLEGRTLWVVVMKGSPDGRGASRALPRLRGVVTGGAIDVSCERCLPNGTYYATVAVVADTDETPGCSPADRVLDWGTPIMILEDYAIAFYDEAEWGQPARTDAAWLASRRSLSSRSDPYDVCAWIAR